MKKIVFLSLIVGLIIMSSCSTPYKMLPNLKTLDEMEYRYPVKKIHLPESGFDIAFTDEGGGSQTIIFIHGLGSYSQAFVKNIDGLKSNFRCIAIDLPGYGKSSKEPHSGLMSFYASIVNELITELDISEVILAGHSMGGQIAITTALLYPNVVEGLALVAPAGFERFHKGQKQWFRDVTTVDGVKLTTPEAIHNNLATNFYNLPQDAEFMITDRISMRSANDFEAYCYAVAQSVNGMVNEPVIDYLEDVKVPTLILFGENDNLIPNRFLNPGPTERIANNGASKIPNSKLVMVPKCGHFLMFEKSDIFNAQVIEFFDK